MSTVAILGAGPLGGAIAHAIAEQQAFRDVRLIDERASVAAGKALDLRQMGPVGRFDTHLTSGGDPLDAAGADVIVVADRVEGGEWEGEAGLAMVGRLARAGTRAPFVFAGAAQAWLLRAAAVELKLPADRLVGTAPAALVGAVRAMVALEVDGAGTDVHVSIVGRPGGLIVAWSAATTGGRLVTDVVPAHRLLAISDGLKRLWPPGPRAIAAPTAAVARALVGGSRRLHQALCLTDGEFGSRHETVMLPLAIAPGRIARRVMPALSPQERVQVERHLR
ncbi:MAG: hypothetical protein R2752_16385 [Vicinamibacterales bacterium]